MSDELKDKVNLAVRYFRFGKYKDVVNNILVAYNKQDYPSVYKSLDKLPNKEKLLKDLLKSLSGKSIVKTWVKVLRGSGKNKYTEGKALFSLGTHICIELEKDNGEYLILLEDVYSRIGKFIMF